MREYKTRRLAIIIYVISAVNQFNTLVCGRKAVHVLSVGNQEITHIGTCAGPAKTLTIFTYSKQPNNHPVAFSSSDIVETV